MIRKNNVVTTTRTLTMKNLSQRYLRSYNLWEQQNHEELYELLSEFESVFYALKKYFNLSLYFINFVSKKIIKYSYLLLKALFNEPVLKRHVSPELVAEDVSKQYKNGFHF